MKVKYILFKFILLCCVLICINVSDLLAQEKQIRYKLKVEVKLLYVLALDKKGNPVTDLQKEDFQLLVDGQPQEIESFSLISHTAKKAISEQKEFEAEELDIQDISAEEAGGNKRFILAALPFSFKSLSHLNRAKKALTHLIEQARYPEDWIGIVVIHGDWIATIQDFTSSREKLLQKIDAYFSFDRKKLNSLENQYPLTAEEIYQVPQLPIFRGFIPVSGGIDDIPALKLVSEKMGVLEGRKIIICFGLPLRVFGLMDRSIRDYSTRFWSFLEMIDKMLSYNITVYYTELEIPRISGSFDASSAIKLDSPLLPGGSIYHPEWVNLRYLRFLHEATHFTMANETGGKYYHNITSPTYCIDDIEKINSSYYLISFTITEEFRKKKSHTIRLECQRKGVKLFYGNKYYVPEELEVKKFEEIYKRTQLYKYLFLDTMKQPALKIYGQWIPLPSDEEQFYLGAVDFYLPAELFQKLPISYQIGCSYSDSEEKGIIVENEINFSPSKKDKSSASPGCVVRVLAKMPEGQKSLRMVVMDGETGEYGRYDVDIGEYPERTDFSNILLGRLLEEGPFYECRDYSQVRFNLKKELYNLLSMSNRIIIPSINNTFRLGEQIAFCLIRKIPPEQSKKYDKQKVIAKVSSIETGEDIKIKMPILRKKVLKNYRQYYGIINTTNLKIGRYQLKLDIKEADDSIIAAWEANFEIIK